MARNQSKRLPPGKIEADESGFAALQTIASYTPINPAYSLDAVRRVHLELENLRRAEAQAQAALAATRDGTVAKEWEFHNLMLGVVSQCMAEITVLAEKGGVSRADFLAFLNDSVMGSMFTRYKTPALSNLDFHVTFTPELLRKDIDLGLSAARTLGEEHAYIFDAHLLMLEDRKLNEDVEAVIRGERVGSQLPEQGH